MIVTLLERIKFNNVADTMKWIFLIFPHYSLSDGLMSLNVNNTNRQICSKMCKDRTINMEPGLLCSRIAPNVTNVPLCKLITAPNFPHDFESFCHHSLRGMSTLNRQLQCENVIEKYTACSLDVLCHRFEQHCCCK